MSFEGKEDGARWAVNSVIQRQSIERFCRIPQNNGKNTDNSTKELWCNKWKGIDFRFLQDKWFLSAVAYYPQLLLSSIELHKLELLLQFKRTLLSHESIKQWKEKWATEIVVLWTLKNLSILGSSVQNCVSIDKPSFRPNLLFLLKAVKIRQPGLQLSH